MSSSTENDHAILLACYRSGQIPEAAWQEHLKDEGLRAYVARNGGGETLAEELARLVREYQEPDTDGTQAEAWNLIADFAVENADAILSALSAAVPADVAGLVGRLQRAAETETEPSRSAISSEAATTLVSMSAELAKARKHIRRQAEDVVTLCKLVYADAETTWQSGAERTEAALAEARKALGRGASLVESFLRYFNPNDLPEDQSQQWQQLERWLRTACRTPNGGVEND